MTTELTPEAVRTVLTAWVPGLPKTKGSLDHLGGGRVRENVVGSSAWRVMMVERFIAATAWHTTRPIIPAGVRVSVWVAFWLPVEPASVGSGDIDKLLRNVFDALSAHTKRCAPSCRKHAGIYADDVQVVDVFMRKWRATERGPGVDVSVSSIGA